MANKRARVRKGVTPPTNSAKVSTTSSRFSTLARLIGQQPLSFLFSYLQLEVRTKNLQPPQGQQLDN